jgi:ADP-ribose pyrophosphatase YjhB (NUDIX family)
LVKNININHWSLPGGKIDKGETPEACLLRELKDELALSMVKIDYKLGEYLSNKEGKRDAVYIFVVKLLSPDFQKQWELEEAQWFPLSHLPENISPAASRRISEFQNGSRNLLSAW